MLINRFIQPLQNPLHSFFILWETSRLGVGREWLLAMVVVLLGFLLQAPGWSQEQKLHQEEWMQGIIGISKIQRRSIPKDLLKRLPTTNKEMIPLEKYFEAFPRLSIKEGFELDFVYDYQAMGGHPILYARPKNDPPFPTLREFKEAYPRSYFLGGEVRFNPAYLEALRTDGTADGFLHLATLILMGEQFFLHWHAVYEFRHLIPDTQTLKETADGLGPEIASKAASIDPQPLVTMGEKEVTVQYLVFTPWEGFSRISWTVARRPPHKLLRCKRIIVLPYKTPLRF